MTRAIVSCDVPGGVEYVVASARTLAVDGGAAMVKIEGQGLLQMKAPMAQLNGDGMLMAKGGLTMIN